MNRCAVVGSLALLLAITTAAGTAHAEVIQPNGTVMPVDSANGEVQLYTYFAGRGEAIDFRLDGRSSPSTFSPLCDFRATFALKQSGSSLGVGWYNVIPGAGAAPTLADIHVIVPAGSAVGTVITAADIRGSADYLGGLIGFALVGEQTHYTEPQWNPICTSCSTPAPWVMAVIYPSTVTPNAFYVAFEDGSVSGSSFNNDGDYNDYVYFFEGLACAGGGVACDTGLPGICSAGLTECEAGGLTCRANNVAGTEACNGLDDDCNGLPDDGELCASGEVCDGGSCVRQCKDEFGCRVGLECNEEGYCVEEGCAAVTCDAGEACRGGECVAPCDSIFCPGDQVCRVGRCVDPCDGITCDGDRICDGGVCVPTCDCLPCSAGLACGGAGTCVDAACVDVDCTTPGTICVEGACVDACVGALCPVGQHCEIGACIDDPIVEVDAGRTDGGAVTDGGGSVMDGGTGEGDAGRGPISSGGCGCRATGGSNAGLGLFALVALALIRRRR
jgi:MYXO-CTERM domain-containing protein